MNLTPASKQQGAALVISLIFLVLITIIGVSSIRGTTMNELISSNTQLKSTTFQVSESVIEGVWDAGYILKNTPTVDVDDTMTAEDETTSQLTSPANDDTLYFNDMFNIPAVGSTAAVDVSANATLQYCGEEPIALNYQISADESDVTRQAAHIYSIHGIGSISSTHASADHDQRGFVVRNAAGREGSCS